MNGRDSREWLVPLFTGLGFFVLLIVSFAVMGEPKDADHSPAEIAEWYVDNKDAAEIGAFISVLAAAVLIFFGAYLRKVLAAAEGVGSMLPVLPLIGVAIVAVGAAIDSLLIFAAAEAAGDVPDPTIQTIQAIWDNDFATFALGIIVFLWSVGIAVLRSGALPKWLGWAAVVFGVVSIAGPAAFFAAPLAGLWVIVASIVLSRQARSATAAPTAA
jgi:hypothetical protein